MSSLSASSVGEIRHAFLVAMYTMQTCNWTQTATVGTHEVRLFHCPCHSWQMVTLRLSSLLYKGLDRWSIFFQLRSPPASFSPLFFFGPGDLSLVSPLTSISSSAVQHRHIYSCYGFLHIYPHCPPCRLQQSIHWCSDTNSRCSLYFLNCLFMFVS